MSLTSLGCSPWVMSLEDRRLFLDSKMQQNSFCSRCIAKTLFGATGAVVVESNTCCTLPNGETEFTGDGSATYLKQ